MQSTIVRTGLILVNLLFFTASSQAANVSDGLITPGASDFGWNSDQGPNTKWGTDNHNDNMEFDDGSGGDKWDVNFLGTDIDRSGGSSMFQFGVVGGDILTGQNQQGSRNLFLGDIAINIVGDDAFESDDPTENSSGFDYAIRLLSTDAVNGIAEFQLLQAVVGSEWEKTDIYGYRYDGRTDGHHGGHYSDTYRLNNGEVVEVRGEQTFSGAYTADTDATDGNDDYVLEASFDLGLLSLFDEQTGGRIITYLTMSCVNDEAIVVADIAPVPVPAAFWLFGTALIGFIGYSRRTQV